MGILAKIIEKKREEVKALHKAHPVNLMRDNALSAPPAPSFYQALSASGAPHLIAEVKKASPSKGVIREAFDPFSISKHYEDGGAAALSVLTDADFFQGSLDFIPIVRRAVSLPILRKDFIIDEAQVYQSRTAGASAILLIAAALEAEQMAELHQIAESVGLDVLVEVHDKEDIAKIDAGGCPARIVGINNRNLNTFNVDLATTEALAAELKDKYILVSESGIFEYADVARVYAAGARAILVGESLMRQSDPGVAAQLLMTPAGEKAG